MTSRWGILALIMAAQTMANVGPLGIPSIAPLIREDLGLSMAQAGSFGIGWNGVQHTLLAEIVGIRAAGTAVGLGLAVSSCGVTLGPPLFGLAVERLGGFAMPWVGLGLAMVATLCLLIPVREGRMETP